MDEKKAKMLKFIMGKGHQPSADRLKVQKELFGFSRVSVFIFCHDSRSFRGIWFSKLLFKKSQVLLLVLCMKYDMGVVDPALVWLQGARISRVFIRIQGMRRSFWFYFKCSNVVYAEGNHRLFASNLIINGRYSTGRNVRSTSLMHKLRS